MDPGDSVTRWIAELKAGEEEAAQKLWQRYFEKLAAVARRSLKGRALGVADEEDLALSAFNTLFRRAGEGRFPRLEDRSQRAGHGREQ